MANKTVQKSAAHHCTSGKYCVFFIECATSDFLLLFTARPIKQTLYTTLEYVHVPVAVDLDRSERIYSTAYGTASVN